MANFATKNINSVSGKQRFQQLVIVRESNSSSKDIDPEILDGELDRFEAGLQQTELKHFTHILNSMDRVANNQMVPRKKFHELTKSKKDPVKEYEFKSGDLRVYAIDITGGKLVVLGGYKNSQDSDINRFKSLKSQYIESQKTKQ